MYKLIPVYTILQDFTAVGTPKMSQLTLGVPEDQVRAMFENFMKGIAAFPGWNPLCAGGTPLPDRLGRGHFCFSGCITKEENYFL